MDRAQIIGEMFLTPHFKEHKSCPGEIYICKDSLSFQN